jgi:hypothetical protein
LASIEYGRTPLRYPIGYRLCFIFDVNYQWLTTGKGEIKATTAALELPPPERVRKRALWSEVFDDEGLAKTGPAPGTAKRAKEKAGQLIPKFDPKGHVTSFINDLFAKEKFNSPLERQEFALEITSYARELALRIRRERTGERYLAVSTGRRDADSGLGRAAGGSSRNVGAVSRLKASIRALEQHAARLNALMEKAASSAPHSHSTEPEVKSLQDAVEKIAGQIDGAGARLKILLAPK